METKISEEEFSVDVPQKHNIKQLATIKKSYENQIALLQKKLDEVNALINKGISLGLIAN